MATPDFEILTPSDTLIIPLSTSESEIGSVEVYENRTLQTGESILSGALANSHRPVMPGEGVTQTLTEAQLTNGRSMRAMRVAIARSPAWSMIPVESTDHMHRALSDAKRDTLPGGIMRLQDAGIHADRASSPNLIAQLSQAVKRPIDSVICCLLDSDPATPLQARLASDYAIEVLAGIAFIQRLTGAGRAAVASTTLRRPAIIRARLKDLKISEISLTGDYPQSDPSMLVHGVLERKLRPGRLPTEVGVIVLDAAAAIAVGRFVLLNEPMTHVPVAVHDWRQRKTRYAVAPIGISVAEVLQKLKIPSDHLSIRGGDSLRDLRITSDAVVSGSELVIHLSDLEPANNPDPCIRCGWCVEVCPTRVQPAGVLEAAQRNDADLAERMGISACIECGLCSFVCPSRLPLLGAIRKIKESKPLMNADSRSQDQRATEFTENTE